MALEPATHPVHSYVVRISETSHNGREGKGSSKRTYKGSSGLFCVKQVSACLPLEIGLKGLQGWRLWAKVFVLGSGFEASVPCFDLAIWGRSPLGLQAQGFEAMKFRFEATIQETKDC